MSTSDDDNNQSDAHPCPSCDDSFNSIRGMKIHHALAHDESIAGVDVICEWCDDKFSVTKDREDSARFCSLKCRGEWQSEHIRGENHHRYSRTTKDCEWCGESYEAQQYRADDARFCSLHCWAHFYGDKNGGSHRSVDPISKPCDHCGVELELLPFKLDYFDHHFCDIDCRSKWQSETIRGPEHFRWKENSTLSNYGEGWDEAQRELVRERDNRMCQGCGRHEEEELDELGCRLSVHHIRRPEDVDDPNDPDNLVSFCRSCHGRWEGLPIRPQ